MLGEEIELDPMNVWRCDQLSAAEGGINCPACGHGATKSQLLIELKPELSIPVLTRFPDANRHPWRIESGAGFRWKTLRGRSRFGLPVTFAAVRRIP
jgi:hypothetical protein